MKTTLVYFTVSDVKMVGARHLLAEEGIESFVLDKKDSAYAGVLGGSIELYVRKDESEKAHALLTENGYLEE